MDVNHAEHKLWTMLQLKAILELPTKRKSKLSRGLYGAVKNGHYDFVKYLEKHLKVEFSTRAIALDGCLCTIRFLCEQRHMKCTTNAMDYAAAYDYLSIVKYLHFNCTEGCSANAMDLAA
ncbi:hypothetical protein THRCLA_20986, partial [Thraustotheca clavata]